MRRFLPAFKHERAGRRADSAPLIPTRWARGPNPAVRVSAKTGTAPALMRATHGAPAG